MCICAWKGSHVTPPIRFAPSSTVTRKKS
jgi:hypothetical protein